MSNMKTNDISEQALDLQIQVLEERNTLLEKEIRRLAHRCQALERFYREIVVRERGYLHPGMNVSIQEAGFSIRVLKRLEEVGMKVLGDLIFCQRRVYQLRGLGRKSNAEIKEVLEKHGLQLDMDICDVFDEGEEQ
jgi:DNA-directed RNA polymerase alpha subunit